MGSELASMALGISVGLGAYCVQSFGLTLQRKSHVLTAALPPAARRPQHRRPLWLLGLAIFLSSNILGSLVQIATLPVVILAPLGAVSLLWNALFAWCILGDIFSLWMIIATILIAAGAVLIAVFGIVTEQPRSLEDLLLLFSRPAFLIYFSILAALVLICLILTHVAEYSFSRRSPQLVDSPLSVPQLPTEHSRLIETRDVLEFKHADNALRTYTRTRLLIAISYASFSGILSGMCLLFAKSAVELLLLTIKGNNQFWRWQAWGLVLGLVVFALLQLWYLQNAIVLADPTLVCPSAFCFYNVSSIVNGLVYFNQISLIPPLHLLLVVLGMIILLAGVWVITIHSEPPADTSDEDDDHEQEHVTIPTQPESSSAALQAGREWMPQRRRSQRYQLTIDSGIQIGLSPLSPGFEIVPRGRRRVVSEGG
ncbi:hypothetical protein APHAL10511_006382 [Amanita phalloides]|nr:hypothetical protein APHAL10511_006382 [Amanita phalloides]